MTAHEAREAAISKLTDATNSQYAQIIEMVKDAAEKGEFEIWVYNIPIKAVVAEKLTELGYKVGPTQSDRNELMTKVSW